MKFLFLKLFLSLFSILFAFFCVEFYLRVPHSKDVPPVPLEISTDSDPLQHIKNLKLTDTTFNIYYFGESTMAGVPYQNTIPIMVNNMLDAKLSGKSIRWINLASTGVDLELSKNRIEWVLKNKEISKPSLIILYAGHNQFLKFHDCCGFQVSETHSPLVKKLVSSSKIVDKIAEAFHLYKVEIDDRSYFDVPVIELGKFSEVVDEYENSLENIYKEAESQKIPIIISTVVGNYSDFEPNRSVFCENNNKIEEFKKVMEEGKNSEVSNDFEKAKSHYLQAIFICNQFAETHFRLGKVYEYLGSFEEAGQAYQMAIDLDKMPIRVFSKQNKFISSIKESEFIHIVDPLEQLREKSSNSLIGFNVMSDGHHPNLTGYEYISQLLAKKIIAISSEPQRKINEDFNFSSQFITSQDSEKAVYLGRAEWFIRLSTWRYDPSFRLQVAQAYLEKASQIQPVSAREEILYMLISIIEKDYNKATDSYRKAQQINEEETEKMTNDPWISEFIKRMNLAKVNL